MKYQQVYFVDRAFVVVFDKDLYQFESLTLNFHFKTNEFYFESFLFYINFSESIANSIEFSVSWKLLSLISLILNYKKKSWWLIDLKLNEWVIEFFYFHFLDCRRSYFSGLAKAGMRQPLRSLRLKTTWVFSVSFQLIQIQSIAGLYSLLYILIVYIIEYYEELFSYQTDVDYAITCNNNIHGVKWCN